MKDETKVNMATDELSDEQLDKVAGGTVPVMRDPTANTAKASQKQAANDDAILRG